MAAMSTVGKGRKLRRRQPVHKSEKSCQMPMFGPAQVIPNLNRKLISFGGAAFNMHAEIIDTLLPVPQRLFVY
jgi:hypothetical protein